jgi:hypothetical protein
LYKSTIDRENKKKNPHLFLQEQNAFGIWHNVEYFSLIYSAISLPSNAEEGDDEVKEIFVVFSCIHFQNVLYFLRHGSVGIYFAGPSHAQSAAGQNGCSFTDVPASS